jgi:hypothetical protein
MDLDEFFANLPPETRWRKTSRWVRHHTPKDLYREVKWGVQRWRRGYSDSDVWSFDYHLAWIVPPAMRQLNATRHGVPAELVEECGSPEAADVKWGEILEAVARGFDAQRTILEECLPQDERLADLERQWREGSELLIKHFGSFWD